MERPGILHHRPGESPQTAEYWVAVVSGVPEIVRVRQVMNSEGDMGHVVERFDDPTVVPLNGEWVTEHVKWIGSVALR
jgi:hypothetical protein